MRTLLPFGPQHPVLPEPIKVKLSMEGERVTDVALTLGFCHRGIEKAMEQDVYKALFLIERICGICSNHHTTNYAYAVEKMVDAKTTRRTDLIRIIMLELERLHSHPLIMALYADALGYENYFMQAFRDREHVMRLLEFLSGNRVQYAINRIGGLSRDFSDEHVKSIKDTMEIIEPKFQELSNVLENDITVKLRTKGIAVITKKDAEDLGAVGPVARASGLPFDVRTEYAIYNEIGFKPFVFNDGDNYSRMLVRCREMMQSIEMVRKLLKLLEPTKGQSIQGMKVVKPVGEAINRLEAPRGELFEHVIGNGTTNLERCRARTPTYANALCLPKMLIGYDMADVPVSIVSIDPCISCTER